MYQRDSTDLIKKKLSAKLNIYHLKSFSKRSKRKKKKNEKKQGILRTLRYILKQINMHYENQRKIRKKEAESIFEDIMAENIPTNLLYAHQEYSSE